MKCFWPAASFIFITCSNPFVNPIQPNGVAEKPPSGFSCNYAQQKINCKRIIDSGGSEKNKLLTTIICDSIMPCWYGTPWNFYGTSETPGKGAIACGYFVTTIIRDAGIPVNRIKMAQVPSEEMIKTLCERTSIKRFSNQSISEFVTAIKKMPHGLYIIGLDNHTGFIYNNQEDVYFIHSNYATPKCVVKEFAISSSVLASSKYRVIGKLKIE